jgi:hypothetical protein
MTKCRRYFFYGSLLLLLSSCGGSKPIYMFTSFHEPATDGLRFLYSRDGYHWTDLGDTFLRPAVGGRPTANAENLAIGRPPANNGPSASGPVVRSAKPVMRDPSIAQGPDGVFHLVWTCGWEGDKGFGYASSRDLIRWSDERYIPVMEQEPATVNVWAPEIFYDADSARFIIVWASTIPHRFPRGEEPEDNNHRLYYTTTMDFKTFAPTALFLDPGFSAIDAMIVRRGGKELAPGAAPYVLVFKDNTRPQRDIKVAFSDKATGPYGNVSPAFTEPFTEGPTTTRVGRDWLIYFDMYRKKTFGAVKTRDFKTFTDISGQVSVPAGHKHGTIFKTSRKVLNKLKAYERNKPQKLS